MWAAICIHFKLFFSRLTEWFVDAFLKLAYYNYYEGFKLRLEKTCKGHSVILCVLGPQTAMLYNKHLWQQFYFYRFTWTHNWLRWDFIMLLILHFMSVLEFPALPLNAWRSRQLPNILQHPQISSTKVIKSNSFALNYKPQLAWWRAFGHIRSWSSAWEDHFSTAPLFRYGHLYIWRGCRPPTVRMCS